MDKNFFISTKSAVNFCEQDLFICGIGEIWNVQSSFIMVGFGLYGLYNVRYKFDKEYNLISTHVKTKLNVLYTLLSFVGLGSAFFHAHLSPFAHWIDIIFISLILVYSQYILSDSQYILSDSNKLLNKFRYIIFILIHIITSIYIPQFHIFLLFGTGFNIKKSIEYRIDAKFNLIQSYNYNQLTNKYLLIKKYFVCALIFWIIDYFGCIFITPYHVHWIFHILIGIVSYKIIDFVRYLE